MRFHRLRQLALAALAAILVLPGLLAAAPHAGAQEACFPETGQCVQEPFLTYWRTHGGLAIHGYPLSTASPEQLEDGKTYTVQYFERSRFELHPENAGTPFEVLLGQFGRLLYLTDPGQPLATAAAPLPGAIYFNATGHNLRGDFLAYWEANGGLAQFGYPISEELRERLEDGKEYTVQYFERARFEMHPENAPPYNILLGQFGRRILNARVAPTSLPYSISGAAGQFYGGNPDVRVRLGLPTANAALQIPASIQMFERGAMIWRGDTRTIYVFTKETTVGPGLVGYPPLGSWLSYPDTWDESQPAGGEQVSPTLWQPRRGFGKVWRERPEVQQRIGYAISAQETGITLIAQPFVGGQTLEAIVDCNYPPYDPNNPPPPPSPVCVYNGTGLYVLYTNGRFQKQY